MNWEEWHNRRKQEYLDPSAFRTIDEFSDNEKICLGSANANCYSPKVNGKCVDGWRANT